jgi:hypothetical protein
MMGMTHNFEVIESEAKPVSGSGTFSAPPRKQKMAALEIVPAPTVAQYAPVAAESVSLKHPDPETLNFPAMSNAALGAVITESFSALELLSKKAQHELRERMLPALREVKERFADGRLTGSLHEFYRALGVNPATVRTWEHRDREKVAKLLESQPEPTGETVTREQETAPDSESEECAKLSYVARLTESIASDFMYRAQKQHSAIKKVLAIVTKTPEALEEFADEREELAMFLREEANQLTEFARLLDNMPSNRKSLQELWHAEIPEHLKTYGRTFTIDENDDENELQPATMPETETIGV